MSNVQLIYKQLRDAGVSEAGALGLMGNWMAESGLEPGRLQGDFTQGRTYSRAYTDDVASGRIGRSQFGRDQKGYGLAQWTYYTRKEDLYDFWNSSGKALDDAGMQVSFAVQELRENGEYAGLALERTENHGRHLDRGRQGLPPVRAPVLQQRGSALSVRAAAQGGARPSRRYLPGGGAGACGRSRRVLPCSCAGSGNSLASEDSM